MRLNELHLEQFRNYEEVHLSFPGWFHVFYGGNAQGKTNLLEAIYALSMTKSHRTHQDQEMIHWGAEQALVKGRIAKKGQDSQLLLLYQKKGKKASVNQLEQRRLSSYIGTLNVVMFAPEDLQLIKGSPFRRRRFIDMEIGQTSPTYLHLLAQYHRLLKQRNQLLKTPNPSAHAQQEALLAVWDKQMAEYGVKILLKRLDFIKKLEKWAQENHRKVSGGSEALKIVYEMSINLSGQEDPVNVYLTRLHELRGQEFKQGMTLVGPHRDDFVLYINDKNVRIYGSQGQQRTAAFSLKLAEIEFIYEEVGDYPLLLLDDVFSELDEMRQTDLIRSIQDRVQTFLTTTSLESIRDLIPDEADVLEVRGGKVAVPK